MAITSTYQHIVCFENQVARSKDRLLDLKTYDSVVVEAGEVRAILFPRQVAAPKSYGKGAWYRFLWLVITFCLSLGQSAQNGYFSPSKCSIVLYDLQRTMVHWSNADATKV